MKILYQLKQGLYVAVFVGFLQACTTKIPSDSLPSGKANIYPDYHDVTIPPNIAMLFTRVYRRIVIWSIVAGFLGTVAGYVISYFAGIPVGATIIFTLTVIWVIAKLASQIRANTN
jgi:hypothetical protein